MNNLKDQVVVVTDVRCQTGRIAALDFARAGADVAIIDLDPKTVCEVAQEIEALGRRALPICTNMLEWSEIQAAIARVILTFSRIDILYNNMGIHVPMGVSYTADPDLDWDLEWNWMIGARLKAALFCCKAVLGIMRAQNRGRIINVAPCQEHNADEILMPHSIFKAGVVGMTKNLANQVTDYNIRVNAICPSDVNIRVLDPDHYGSMARLLTPQKNTQVVYPEKKPEDNPLENVQDVSQNFRDLPEEPDNDAYEIEEIRSVLPLFTEDVSFVTGYCHEISQTRTSGDPWAIRSNSEIAGDGTKAIIEYTAPAHLGSWTNVLHGGVVSTLLDEAMGLVGTASFKQAAFTAALEVRFRNPTPVCTNLIIEAHRTKMSRKLLNVDASIALEDGTICATGRGKMMPAA